MDTLLAHVPPLVAALGLLAIVLAVLTGHARAGLSMGLELWTAAGLLGLTGDAGWAHVATAAAIITVRRFVVHALRPQPKRAPA